MPTLLDDFVAHIVNTYFVETAIAEKLDTILSLTEFSGHMKDYYDIYYLENKFNFNGKVQTEVLRETFINWKHSFSIAQFEEVMEFADDTKMHKRFFQQRICSSNEKKII